MWSTNAGTRRQLSWAYYTASATNACIMRSRETRPGVNQGFEVIPVVNDEDVLKVLEV